MSINPKKSLQCGSCSYLIRDKVFESKCSDLGRIITSRSCTSHKPDVFALSGSEEKIQLLSTLGEIMSQLSVGDMQVIGAMFLNEKTTRKQGLKFKQKVYVRVCGSSNANYMSNFVVGYILDATKDTVRVIGESGAVCISAISEKNSETFYTAERFSQIRIDMVANKKYLDPSLRIDEEKVKRRNFQSILPLDEAADLGVLNKKALKKQMVKDDLVSLVSRLGRGHTKSKRASQDENAEISVDWR